MDRSRPVQVPDGALSRVVERPAGTHTRWRPMRWLGVALAGGMWLPGCLAGLQQNLDLLLSPAAGENLMRLPFSSVWPVMELLLRLGR